MYVAPSGLAHWRDPIGVLVVTACQGNPMELWRQVAPGEVPPGGRCRSSGCVKLWREFDQARRATDSGRSNGPEGAVTDNG